MDTEKHAIYNQIMIIVNRNASGTQTISKIFEA